MGGVTTGAETQTEAVDKEATRPQREQVKGWGHKPRSPAPKELEEARGDSPLDLQRDPALRTP